ncbi:MAG TPA: hypothetical protein VGB73_15145 [Pyrinomonadaceae bacterium]|jgi:multisubunit Na+/H+ antiporter MnhB subunit
MRWKLFLITSLVAALLGAGASFGLAYFLRIDASRASLAAPGLAHWGLLLIPVAIVTFASIFVYRHTPRRRALQATITALLSIVFTLAALYAILFFFASPAIDPTRSPTPPRPDNVG